MTVSCLQNHANFQKEQLSRIDNDLMQAKQVLVDITEPRRLCLEELGLRKHFVKWVKDALEGKCLEFAERITTLYFNPNSDKLLN